jgi:filamentous hemagglutinin
VGVLARVKTAVKAVAISSVVVGTSVLAFNEKTKLEEIQPVTATISHGEKLQPVVTLTLETSDKTRETVETTPEHPFAVRVGEDGQIAWVNAIDLEGGQSLARADGKSGRLVSRSVEARDQRMYNLAVQDVSTYHVGDAKWLVHNCTPGIDKPFRSPNSDFPPNPTAIKAAQELPFNCYVDCSEFAENMLKATGGQGSIIRVTPGSSSTLTLLENGRTVGGYAYHEVYTDGRYVWDPYISRDPIPLGDWQRLMGNLNPGMVIKK